MAGATDLPLELVDTVMEQLGLQVGGQRFLYQAMQVNRTWGERASMVLWRAPPTSALMRVRPNFRQFYANCIYQLSFVGFADRLLHFIYRDLQFRNLRYIDIDHLHFELLPAIPVGQYIQRNLRHFKLLGGLAEEEVPNLLRENCPRLESVELGYMNRFPGLQADERLINLFNSKSLKSISIRHRQTPSVTRNLILFLAYYDSLERLTLHTFFDMWNVHDVFDTDYYLFRNIRYLDLRVESTFIPPLVRCIHPAIKLSELHLVVEGNLINPLPHVCSLQFLQVLCLTFMEPAIWPGNDILELWRLQLLRILRITSMGAIGVVLHCPTLTIPVFDFLLRTKNDLQELDFQVRTNLGFQALVSLGRNCPQLRVCKIYGVYDLRRFRYRHDSPYLGLFPRLEHLELARIVPRRR